MDKTSFMPKITTRNIISIKGIKNVRTEEKMPNFHMSVVAAISASNFTVSHLIILPGVSLHKTELAALSIYGARVTGAPKKFSNAKILKYWINSFSIVLKAQGFKSQSF